MMTSNGIFILVSTVLVIVTSRQTTNAYSIAGFNTDKTDWAESLVSSCFPNDFKLYWSVGTINCHQFGFNFSEVSEKFGIIQNHDDYLEGENVAGTLLQTDKKLEYHMKNFPDNFSGLGIMRLYPCPKKMADSVLKIFLDVQHQRPNATWTLNDYPCSADQFEDIPQITSEGRSSSPSVSILRKWEKQEALSVTEDYISKLEKTLKDNEIKSRIILNFWMTLSGGHLFSKFGPYFAYDVIKIFMNHGFCEVSLMASGAALNNRGNCEKFHQYLNDDFGPGILIMRENLHKIAMNRCSTEQPSSAQPPVISTVSEAPQIQLPPPKVY